MQEEVFGQGNLESVDELLAPDYVSHAPGDPELSRGPEDIKEIVRAYHSAFPDINFAVEKQVAEGDMVVTRWIARGTHRGEFLGVPPSGRRIEVSGMSMDRIPGAVQTYRGETRALEERLEVPVDNVLGAERSTFSGREYEPRVFVGASL